MNGFYNLPKGSKWLAQNLTRGRTKDTLGGRVDRSQCLPRGKRVNVSLNAFRVDVKPALNHVKLIAGNYSSAQASSPLYYHLLHAGFSIRQVRCRHVYGCQKGRLQGRVREVRDVPS